MRFHDNLNEKIWDLETNDMLPEVKEKLKEIAEAFIEFLEIPTDAVLDKVITGSSASYNYNKYSDLDLHIIVDYDKVHEDCPLVNGYLNSLKKQFNDNHDITIHDVPVELYAEQKDQGTVHNGLYSLQTGWIDKPQKIEPTDNDAAVEAKFNEIKELVDKCDDSEEATELLEKIYNMRKAGLAEAGEFCTENLAFKKLRNEGCMDKLRQIKKEQIDKQLSLESYNETSNEIEFDWDKIINLREQGKIKSIRFGNIEIGDRLLTFNGMYCNGILKVEKKNTTRDSKGNLTYEVIGTREEPVCRDCGCNAYAYGEREFEIVDDDVTQLDIIKDKNESIKENKSWVKFGKDGEKIKTGSYIGKVQPQKIPNSYIATVNIEYKKQPLYMQTFNDKEKAKSWVENRLPSSSKAESFQKNEANKYSTEEYRAMALNLAKKVAKNAPKAAKQAPATFKVYVGPYDYSILLPYNFTDKECSDAEEYARLMGIPYNKINISALVGNNPKYSVDEEAVIIYPSGKVSDLDGNTINLESAQKNEDSYVESIKEDYNIGDKITINNKQGVIDSLFKLQDDNSLLGVWVKFDNDVKYYTTEELDAMKNESIKEINVDEDVNTLEQKIDAADTTLKDLMDRLNSVTEEIEDTEFVLEKANKLIDEALRED